MKYVITFVIMLLADMANARAQDVYNYVLNNATNLVNSPTSGFTQTQIAQFKRTALIYLKQKAFEQQGTVTAEFLNTQAFYLSEFIALFFDEILKSKKLDEEKRRERILLFMDASVSNPLFVDLDEGMTMSFITSGGEITPFCLNTDWEKAYMAAKSQLHNKPVAYFDTKVQPQTHHVTL